MACKELDSGTTEARSSRAATRKLRVCLAPTALPPQSKARKQRPQKKTRAPLSSFSMPQHPQADCSRRRRDRAPAVGAPKAQCAMARFRGDCRQQCHTRRRKSCRTNPNDTHSWPKMKLREEAQSCQINHFALPQLHRARSAKQYRRVVTRNERIAEGDKHTHLD